MEIGIIMEVFKMEILGTITTQLDVLQAKQKKSLEEQNWVIFYPHCQKKHNQQECPLDMVQTCTICTKDHTIEQFPSLPGLKSVFKEAEEQTKPVYLMNQHQWWQAKPTGMSQDTSQFFPSSSFNQQKNPMVAWQAQ